MYLCKSWISLEEPEINLISDEFTAPKKVSEDLEELDKMFPQHKTSQDNGTTDESKQAKSLIF